VSYRLLFFKGNAKCRLFSRGNRKAFRISTFLRTSNSSGALNSLIRRLAKNGNNSFSILPQMRLEPLSTLPIFLRSNHSLAATSKELLLTAILASLTAFF
jgi:hypothetical protein